MRSSVRRVTYRMEKWVGPAPKKRKRWSEREDSNLREPDPKSGGRPLAHTPRGAILARGRRNDSAGMKVL